jgi:pimeloyl-ACP methyl ester carboxylesterase
MARPLSPDELYPAGVPGVSTRFIALPTGIRVRIVEAGPRDGQPVVLLHGWGASVFMYRDGIALLPGYGLRVIAVDLRGFGLSDHPVSRGAYTLDAYVADLDALLDALSLPAATLVGQSMGGGLALHYALRRPERVGRLALINPTGLVSAPYLAPLRAPPRSAIRAFGRRLAPRWLFRFVLRHLAYGDTTRLTPRVVDEYWSPSQLPGYVNAAICTFKEFDWRPISAESAGRLAVPSVVILGTEDRLIRNARAAAERLSTASVYDVPGGHCVHEEQPERVYAMLGEFFTDGHSVKSHNDLN